jgi:hypothetical protein
VPGSLWPLLDRESSEPGDSLAADAVSFFFLSFFFIYFF